MIFNKLKGGASIPNFTKGIQEIESIVGQGDVLTKQRELLTYRYAATTSGPVPNAVIFPKNTEEISKVMKILNKYSISVIARGAGTNLNGGTVISEAAVILELSKMNRILEVDTINRYILVEPGVTNLEVQVQLGPLGFFFAPDPASQAMATIGGNIAENGGGPRCIKYGVTVNHVLGMEIVLSDGQILTLNGPLEGTPGYDITGIMHASEGTFGIVSKVWLRIMKKPEAVKTLMAIFDTLEDAAQTVSSIVAKGIIPASLELIDGPILQAVEQNVKVGYPLDAEAVLLIEVDGYHESLESQAQKIIQICEQNNVRTTKVAQTEKERELIWLGRRMAVGSIARLKPSYAEEDITIPRTKLPEMLRTIAKIAEKYSLIIGNVFHAGDGNFHPVVLYDNRDAEETKKVHMANFEIMQEAAKIGGTISGEHGIGLEKLKGMPLIFSEEDMIFMRKLKLAFDPVKILNPGKVIPQNIISLADASLEMIAKSIITPTNNKLQALIEELNRKSPTLMIKSDQETLELYRQNGMIPQCICLPQSAQEVSIIVQAANAYGLSLSSWGKGINRNIGEPVNSFDLVINMTKLNKIVDIDLGNLTTTVEAGVDLLELTKILNEQGLMLPVNPIQHETPTIGGLIATNITGGLRLEYKTLKDMVLGIHVVDAQGGELHYGGKILKNVAGYDLCKLFVGSWGTLGVITQLTLKLYPLPEKTVYRIYKISDINILEQFTMELANSNIELTSLDLIMDGNDIYLLPCAGGPNESVQRRIEVLNKLTEKLELVEEFEDRTLLKGNDFILDRLDGDLYHSDHLILKSSILYKDIPQWIKIMQKGLSGIDFKILGHVGSGILYAIIKRDELEKLQYVLPKIIDDLKKSFHWGIHVLETNDMIKDIKDDNDPLKSVSKQLKSMLDPNDVMNRGRSVGGIRL